jgi:CheY-like chemotaxis protein
MTPFTILLVEDDYDVREALAETLRDEGYAVECVGDGQEALDYLRGGGRPTLILLDLMMPRMSGSEFRMVQKVDPELRHLPVVLLSADGRMDEKARTLETAGAVRKPIDLSELLTVIESFRSRAAV